MGNSIQDYLRKINSRLSLFDTVSIGVTAFFLTFSSAYLVWHKREIRQPLIYRTGNENKDGIDRALQPFGSKNGTTYTYSWCQGGDRIKPENKVYYNNMEEAEASGRRISKLCQK